MLGRVLTYDPYGEGPAHDGSGSTGINYLSKDPHALTTSTLKPYKHDKNINFSQKSHYFSFPSLFSTIFFQKCF